MKNSMTPEELYQTYPPQKNFRLLLDSGAYTAWTKAKTIDIDEYISFLKKFDPYMECYISLDVIPEKLGHEEVEFSAQKSYDNYMYMREKGLAPIPVFHQGEKFKWLEKMLEAGADYIGVSPMDDMVNRVKLDWFDAVFDRLTDSTGEPVIKTHGFGLTSTFLLLRYPFYSVDSSAWLMLATHGGIYVPVKTNGEYDYTKSASRINISDRSSFKTKREMHYLTLNEYAKVEIDKYFALKGFTFEELATDYKKRCEINAVYFHDFENALPDRKFNKRLIRSKIKLGVSEVQT
jgi:hypothetical protein